jgi:hypothetical protein
MAWTVFLPWMLPGWWVPAVPVGEGPRIRENVIKFSGEVSKGEVFEKDITDNLVFRLKPYRDVGGVRLGKNGWSIFIGLKRSKPDVPLLDDEEEYNFVSVATPPFHGPNPADIRSCDFAHHTVDEAGRIRGYRKTEDVPEAFRLFYFVLNIYDYMVADTALKRMLWGYPYSEREVREAEIIYDNLKKGKGILIIKDMKINKFTSEFEGEKAEITEIEWMKFDVELHFPVTSSGRRR